MSRIPICLASGYRVNAMSNNAVNNNVQPRKPVAVGTGLLALDIVLNVDSQDSPRCYAGGTCGNVLTVLSYLGWPRCR
jgi:fructokinase